MKSTETAIAASAKKKVKKSAVMGSSAATSPESRSKRGAKKSSSSKKRPREQASTKETSRPVKTSKKPESVADDAIITPTPWAPIAKLEKRGRRSSTFPAARPPADSKMDVYVTRDKRKQSAYKQRVLKLVQERAPQGLPVNIFGLGGAIPSACEVALWVQDASSCPVESNITTNTTNVVDNFSEADGTSNTLQSRAVSRIHIQLVPKSKPTE